MKRFPLILALCFSLFAEAGVAIADSLSIASSDPKGQPTVYSDVKITGVENGRITFTGPAGNQVIKELSAVVDLNLADETDFDDAQRDFLSGRFERAVDEYDRAISKTDKPWLKTFSMPRFTQSADKAGRFDKAVDGFIALVMHDPEDAPKYRPSVPQFGSSYLDMTAGALTLAADVPNITPPQQAALLALLLDIQRARHDTKSMDAVARRLSGNPADSGDPVADLARAALADAKLSDARGMLAARQFDQAIAAIEAGKVFFTDITRQADALFMVAQARQGQAAIKNDPTALADAAIAYLRVVADFKSATGAPHVAESLLAAGGILEKLNQPARAQEMYQSIITDYPQSRQAEQAKQKITRLQPGTTRP